MHPAPQPSQSPYFPHSQPGSYARRLLGYLHVQGAQVGGLRTAPPGVKHCRQDRARLPQHSALLEGTSPVMFLKAPALCQRCGSPENRNCRTRKTKEERTLCQERSGEAVDWVWASSLIYCVISRKSLLLSVPLHCMVDQAALKSYQVYTSPKSHGNYCKGQKNWMRGKSIHV